MSEEKSALAWLRGLERKGTSIGAISSGAFNLAEAGLMEGFKCTIHYEIAPAFREKFPEISLTENIFEIDRNRYTCSGGTSALDLGAEPDRKRPGRRAGPGDFPTVPTRPGERRPGSPEDDPEAHLCLQISTVAGRHRHHGAQHRDAALPTSELAKVIGVSTRQLERIFERHVGMPPNRYYAGLRLERARSAPITNHPSGGRYCGHDRIFVAIASYQALQGTLQPQPNPGTWLHRLDFRGPASRNFVKRNFFELRQNRCG